MVLKLYMMPSTRKQLPNDRKKVTASARAKTSVKKTGSRKASHLDGSYLEKLAGKSVKTVSTVRNDQPGSSKPSSNDAILAMLQEIKDSNTALAQRMDRVEQTARGGTPLNLRSHARDIPNHSSQMGSPVMNPHQGDGASNVLDPSGGIAPTRIQDPTSLRQQHQLQHSYPDLHPSGAPQLSQMQIQDHLQASQQHEHRDAVIPSLHTLRTNPTVADAVNNILTSYEVRTHSDLAQGKPNSRRSGRYNTHDMITAQPHLRWPNEGFQASGGKKRLTYDELSLPQWVAGQLTNIYAMSDPKQAKQAVLQMTLAMRDASSLPWPAVRAAWASSMHQVEEGTLAWADSTQWAINRLSASQIALAHQQPLPPTAVNRRPCKYYNESSCSHDAHHGHYLHVCAHCHRQGRQLSHPESKCNSKQKPNRTQHNTT